MSLAPKGLMHERIKRLGSAEGREEEGEEEEILTRKSDARSFSAFAYANVNCAP